MASVALFILAVLAHLVVLHSAEYSKEEPTKHCPGHFCNDIVGNIRFPFKSPGDPPECGLVTVNCSERFRPKVLLKEGDSWDEFEFKFKGTLSNSIFITDGDLASLENGYCRVLDNLSPSSPSPIPEVSLSTPNMTLLKCYTTLDNISYPQLDDGNCRKAYPIYYIASSKSSLLSPLPPECATIQVSMKPYKTNEFSSWTAEFDLEVETPECFQCFDSEGGECPDAERKFKCPTREKGDKQLKLKLELGKIDISAFKYIIDMDTHLGQASEPKDVNQSFPNASG